MNKRKNPHDFHGHQFKDKTFPNFHEESQHCFTNNERRNHCPLRPTPDDLSREHLRRHMEFYRNMSRQLKYKNDIRHFARMARFIIPLSIMLNIVCIVALFSWLGFGMMTVVAVGGVMLICITGVFARGNFEKRIIRPIESLKHAMEEVANGNLDTEIKVDVMNDVGLLLSTFNVMVARLREIERIKQEYEENRKLLIANISHDLKTPITSIEGYIEAILDKTVTSEDKKEQYLEVIYKNANYMNQLIDDLFLFSKLDMQKLDFNFEDVSINAFIKDIAEEFEFEFSEKGLSFIYTDNMDKEEIIRMDRKRFSQSIRNIIVNSQKHSQNDYLKVEMTLARQVTDMSVVINLIIKDNGSGIPENDLGKIFDRFYRVENARTKNLSSTGLGLSIAKELIEAMDGSITVSSRAEDGTTFTISFRGAE